MINQVLKYDNISSSEAFSLNVFLHNQIYRDYISQLSYHIQGLPRYFFSHSPSPRPNIHEHISQSAEMVLTESLDYFQVKYRMQDILILQRQNRRYRQKPTVHRGYGDERV